MIYLMTLFGSQNNNVSLSLNANGKPEGRAAENYRLSSNCFREIKGPHKIYESYVKPVHQLFYFCPCQVKRYKRRN